MRYLPTTFLVAALAAVLAGCGGGGGDVPSDAVAKVKRPDDHAGAVRRLLAQAKRSYATQKRPFPKAGTPEFATLKNQAVQYLVQRVEFQQEADKLGSQRLRQRDRRAPRKDQEAVLRRQRLALQEAAQAAGPHRRAGEVRHQGSAGPGEDLREGDEQRESLRLRAPEVLQPAPVPVRNARAARRRAHPRQDEGARRQAVQAREGRRELLQAGQAVLTGSGLEGQGRQADDHEGDRPSARSTRPRSCCRPAPISHPIKTDFGYHVIKALSAIKAAKTTPFTKVKKTIRTQLLQQKKSTATTELVDEAEEGLRRQGLVPDRVRAAADDDCGSTTRTAKCPASRRPWSSFRS